MTEHAIAQAQTELAAKDAAIAVRDATIARLTHERDEARALLAHLRTSLNEQHNDPMQDGGGNGG